MGAQRDGESVVLLKVPPGSRRMAAVPVVPSVPVMSRSASASIAPTARASGPFDSILCGVDGSRSAAEAARQAAILAAGRAHLTLLETGSATFLAEAARHDLLVIGDGLADAVHSAPGPVLLARRPPASVEFPASILAAIDGTPATAGVARTAAALALGHGARVSVIAPPGLAAPEHDRLTGAIATIAHATGRDPVVLDEHASAHKAITAAAASVAAALVVIGSRGLQGIHALTSVSERVAHEAPCSVLVLRPAKGSVRS
jgi:nucleotide-binding universal stress UspA family protein